MRCGPNDHSLGASLPSLELIRTHGSPVPPKRLSTHRGRGSRHASGYNYRSPNRSATTCKRSLAKVGWARRAFVGSFAPAVLYRIVCDR